MYLNKICRTCLGTEKLMSVFEDDIVNKLTYITALKVYIFCYLYVHFFKVDTTNVTELCELVKNI